MNRGYYVSDSIDIPTVSSDEMCNRIISVFLSATDPRFLNGNPKVLSLDVGTISMPQSSCEGIRGFSLFRNYIGFFQFVFDVLGP